MKAEYSLFNPMIFVDLIVGDCDYCHKPLGRKVLSAGGWHYHKKCAKQMIKEMNKKLWERNPELK